MSEIDEQEVIDMALAESELNDDNVSFTDENLDCHLEERYSYVKDLNKYLHEWTKNIAINVKKVFRRNLWDENDAFLPGTILFKED